ncbi:MAG: C40 family peptidase [Bacteroidetes bacterium]|nr:C40 family peptidase [Bacteroidota bacterium]
MTRHDEQLRLLLIVLFPLLLAACSSAVETTAGRGVKGGPGSTTAQRPVLPDNLSAGRRAVIGESYDWLGAPYRYAGNSKRGVDCSGLVHAIFKKFDLVLPRRSRDMYGKGRAIKRAQLQPADLVFFANTAGKGISHVGIYVGNDRFIHASTRAGVIVSSLDDPYYTRHYAGARMIIK